MMQTTHRNALCFAATAGCLLAASTVAFGSSHREAPFITNMPKVDGTDLYAFRSYEAGREDTVTLIANYQPTQTPAGGPNFFTLDENAVYEVHIDNDGDAKEEITFRFDFKTLTKGLSVPVDDRDITVPLKNIGGIGPGAGGTGAVNVRQTYQVEVIHGDRRSGEGDALVSLNNGSDTFRKPVDNIGNKSISDYPSYARHHIYDVTIPGCSAPGRVFAGQRQEGFAVNLGEIFDLVNLNPVGPPDGGENTIGNTNITSLALEVPTACLTNGSEPVIGVWTTASVPQARIINPEPAANEGGKGASVQGGAWTQVSRLGMPLVNELVIGLPDKDRFNASEPMNDSQFLEYVQYPTLPELLEILFGADAAKAPDALPRADLVAAFLTGVDGLNQPANVTASEMLRLNTSIAPISAAEQSRLGVLGGDNAGFPNGRRPGDDVVDVELRVAMGILLGDADPNNGAPYTDGAIVNAGDFQNRFPYLNPPLPGSPNE